MAMCTPAQRRFASRLLLVVPLILLGFTASRADATPFCNIQGCAEFPAGAISFADAVVNYSPIFVGGDPGLPYRGDFNALGVPDYADPTGTAPCVDAASCTWVTLGDGGSLTLRFLDNVLTGSGNSNLDLWIFEVGGDVEDTFVEISSDGSLWHPVGKVFGSTSGIDIDAFGFGLGSMFSYVRLTDDPNEGEQFGTFVGADIDAVGAISTLAVNQPVPEPSSLLLFGTGVAAVCRKRLVARRAKLQSKV